MTKWDNLHERYFNYLATLSFDKAKELLDKDGYKMNGDFLQYFYVLVQFERAYHNFGFIVNPKGNMSGIKRDKSLYQCYSELHMSLIEEQSKTKTTNPVQFMVNEMKEINYFQQLTHGLSSFLSVRANLMKVYEQISNAVKHNEHNVRLENYLEEVTMISQIDMSSLNTLALNPIHQLLKYELDCLLLLIQSYVFIANYQYLNAISKLHHMHCTLKEWNNSIDNHRNTSHFFLSSTSSKLNFFRSSTKPALYTFYSNFHELLVAKFTLYFADVLYEYSGIEVKTPMERTNSDLSARIVRFYSSSNAEWILLILHTHKKQIYSCEMNQLDYYSLIQPTVHNIENKPYQIIYGHPSKPDSSAEVVQEIIKKIEINNEMLLNGDVPFYHGDSNQAKTYFLQNIDPRVTLALIFRSYREERDTTITNSLIELIDHFRGSRQFLHFKTASK